MVDVDTGRFTVAVFKDVAWAQKGLQALLQAGFPPESLTVVAKESPEAAALIQKALGVSGDRLDLGTVGVALVHGPLILPEQVYLSKVAGTIRARVYIDEQGTVVSVDIVHAHPVRGVFEEAALEALSQVRYRPAILAGQAVKSQKLIEVKFAP